MTRNEWQKLPIEQRTAMLAKSTPEQFDKYLLVCRRRFSHFSRGTGSVTVEIGGNPAPYRILEDAAWMKYVVNGGK